MENPEEILHSLEEFSKFRPKDIPRELEEYLCFVAKTGDPVYQWSSIKHLFKEKLINVVNEFYESCPLVDIPPCPNVEIFNYDTMKSFILEKLDTFAAAPFTVQRICELLTAPRKEYNRIDKFMRALEKNILVVSTVEPGCKNAENGESIVNGLETEHLPETSNSSTEINVVEMEESPVWQKNEQMEIQFQSTEEAAAPLESQDTLTEDAKDNEKELCTCTSSQDTVETVEKSSQENQTEHISVEPPSDSSVEESTDKSMPTDISTDALPSTQVESDNSEPVVSSEIVDEITESEEVSTNYTKEEQETVSEAQIPTENNDQESLKQADSTTSSKLPSAELIPAVFRFELKKCSEPIEEDTHCEIASSDTENASTDSTSNLISVSTEADTANQGSIDHTATIVNDDEKTIDRALQEENAVDNEDSNSSPADTTRGYERQIDNDFVDKSEDNKDEEITSSDKVVVAVPNTSIDDISDDESEAEAEIQKETSMEIVSEQSDILPNAETPENDSIVTASSDDLRKDCEDTPMEVDSKEKADFNEAEATCSNCESI